MASLPSSSYDVAQLPDASHRRKIDILLVSTVALAFISFWRAAAIVLCDLASTAYYIGGISEQAIGKAAPWFILGVMVFSYAVRSVYVESCTMFTRGGVYRVVRSALGSNLAKLAVSALMFDYVLTGPISAVVGRPIPRRPRISCPESFPSQHRPSRHRSNGAQGAGQHRHRASARWASRSISGVSTSAAFMNQATKPCASCNSPR